MRTALVLTMLAIALISCGENGLYCNASCPTGQFRNQLCGCSNKAQNSPLPPPQIFGPWLHSVWTTGCDDLDSDLYLLNPTPRTAYLDVWISQPDGGERVLWQGSPFKLNPNTPTDQTGYYLGRSEIQLPDGSCFNQDPTAEVVISKQTSEWKSQVSLGAKDALGSISTFAEFTPILSQSIDCKALCDSNPPSPACLSIDARDKSAAQAAQSKFATELKSSTPDIAAALTPLTGTVSGSCSREIKNAPPGGSIVTQGNVCAFPFYISATEHRPSAAVIVPARASFQIRTRQGSKERELVATTSNESAYISFNIPGFTESYGGYLINARIGDGASYYLTSSRGCLAVTTK